MSAANVKRTMGIPLFQATTGRRGDRERDREIGGQGDREADTLDGDKCQVEFYEICFDFV